MEKKSLVIKLDISNDNVVTELSFKGTHWYLEVGLWKACFVRGAFQ